MRISDANMSGYYRQKDLTDKCIKDGWMWTGDIATGTNHGGLNPFHDGDVVELECEGMGKLSINIQDDLKRTWERTTRLERKNKGLEPPHAPQLSGKYAPDK